jgi:hypothetical protein
MQGLFSSKARTPAVLIAPQAISSQQVQRVVMLSIARQSVVTSEGMLSRGLDGKSVPSAYYQPFDKV